MIRGSVFVAMLAVLLSVVAHVYGLTMTATPRSEEASNTGNSDAVELGSAFEDLADTAPEPVEPETAEAPEPPVEEAPQPEPEPAEIPVSEALVAAENPQNVPSPDFGESDVVQPVTSEAEETQAVDPTDGDGAASDDVSETPPVEPDTVTEVPQGTSVETTEPIDTAQDNPVAEPAQQIAALPAPVVTPTPEATIPVVPLEQTQVEPEIVEPQEDAEATEQAVTASLRPRLPERPPSTERAGAPNGSDEFASLRFPSQVIESPLTTYRREGVDTFTGGNTGNSSGGRSTGNSDRTNYAGRVLVHLNRAPTIFVSSRGFARVFFEISPDGSLAWVDIIDSSGSREIDRAAKDQVRAAAPFPPPPGGVSRKLSFFYQNS